MTADAVLVVKTIFNTIWLLFTSWHIPGTNVTPASFFMFCLVFSFILRWLGSLFGWLSSTYRYEPKVESPKLPVHKGD